MTLFYANYQYHPVYTDCAGLDQVLTLPLQLQKIHEVHAVMEQSFAIEQAYYCLYVRLHLLYLCVAAEWV
jgi:hypothetical protein